MTLREEIYNRLTFFSETKDKVEYDRCVKDILKLFDKTIEEKIRQVQTIFYSSSRDTDYLREKRKHEKQILEKLKEELKK